MLLGCLLFGSDAKAALYSTTDTLNGNGGFEFDGGMGPWAKWTGSSEPVSIDSTYKNTGMYSLKIGPSTASSKNNRAETTVATVANRSYEIQLFARFASGSSPSYARVRLGASPWDTSANLSWGNSYFLENLKYYTTTATETSCLLQIGTYSNSANDNLWIDDVKLYQEIVLPNVDSYTGSGTTWTLSNAGGRIGANLQLVAFDPTVIVSYVSGFNVGNIAATWSNDNQLLLSFQNSLAGAVDLQITNPNGNASYTVTMVPEPATISILGLGLLGLIRSRSRR
jgi:hypothetical protein